MINTIMTDEQVIRLREMLELINQSFGGYGRVFLEIKKGCVTAVGVEVQTRFNVVVDNRKEKTNDRE